MPSRACVGKMTNVTSLTVERSVQGLITIGYEGRSAQDLIDALVLQEVDVLADVRLTPVSRKAGLSKRGLAASLAAVGIRYLHLPALGNPRDNRDAFRAGEARSRARFAAELRKADARAAIAELERLLAADHRVALLCYERDPGTCHREIVSSELIRRTPLLAVAHA